MTRGPFGTGALLVVALAGVAATAAADDQPVTTPSDQYYIEYEATPPVGVGNGDLCTAGQPEVCVPVVVLSPGSTQANGAVWKETNGCTGLQTATPQAWCPPKAAWVTPDQRVVGGGF